MEKIYRKTVQGLFQGKAPRNKYEKPKSKLVNKVQKNNSSHNEEQVLEIETDKRYNKARQCDPGQHGHREQKDTGSVHSAGQ